MSLSVCICVCVCLSECEFEYVSAFVYKCVFGTDFLCSCVGVSVNETVGYSVFVVCRCVCADVCD